MSNIRNASPTSNSRKFLLKRRKLPFSENITSVTESESCEDKEKEVNEASVSKDSSPLTPRRNTPLSERQQIALLCRLSGVSAADGGQNNVNTCEKVKIIALIDEWYHGVDLERHFCVAILV
ncbi:uncharacterized protein NPIL_95871 [Nephila pilipes]|uniref:Uncharacterized protein n=1 Tax=Nephila pilipes TaxID=299642 RepID=A0A8X6M708_NEPPI|nr:uncharacterized protein NPIL_95871 [Nephila pilipes]